MSSKFWSDGLDYWERRAIDRVSQDMTEMANAQADGLASQHGLIQKLFALDRAQAREIRELRSAIKVLTEMLSDAGQLDQEVFSYRFEAEVDRQQAEAQQAQEEANAVVCTGCGEKVARSQTQLGEAGLICDRCFYTQR